MAEDHLFKATYASPKDFMDQHILAHETQKKIQASSKLVTGLLFGNGLPATRRLYLA